MIDWSLLLTVTLISIPLSFTPGPNNTICTSIGASHGLVRTLPFCFGVSIGFPLLFIGVGFGIHQFLQQHAVIIDGLKIFSIIFFLYLAYKIGFASLPLFGNEKHNTNDKKPWGFYHGVFFQWFNVKAIAVAISISVNYIRSEHLLVDIIGIAVISSILAILSTTTWAMGGVIIRKFIKTALHFRIFSVIMAISLLFGTLPAILSVKI